ncbi:MAG TPA: MOSC domain-containing protein [Solirubrobacteraceae bacterium]|nr:MOSC domain-containing protein [Solirubrobacteraceae bacterium]
MATVVSVNVGPVAPFRAGRATRSAIVKAPVDGPVAVRGVNLDGDDQADRRNHGGADQAVYAYAQESYTWWQRELGRELPPGLFGENLTVEGLDVDEAVIGDRWAIGSTVLEVTRPRIPCLKLAKRMDDLGFVKRFAQARRPGAYLRIVAEGVLQAGDEISVVARPRHGVTIALVNEAMLFEAELAPRLLEAPALAAGVREWAEARA